MISLLVACLEAQPYMNNKNILETSREPLLLQKYFVGLSLEQVGTSLNLNNIVVNLQPIQEVTFSTQDTNQV